MSNVTKRQPSTSYGRFVTIELNRNRYILLRVVFVISIIAAWIYLSINIVDLLGEVAISTTIGGGTINVTTAVHFSSVIWGVVVVTIVSVLNLLLRRTKK
jgi:hypothetical protein